MIPVKISLLMNLHQHKYFISIQLGEKLLILIFGKWISRVLPNKSAV